MQSTLFLRREDDGAMLSSVFYKALFLNNNNGPLLVHQKYLPPTVALSSREKEQEK